jgi:hypothetical protein
VQLFFVTVLSNKWSSLIGYTSPDIASSCAFPLPIGQQLKQVDLNRLITLISRAVKNLIVVFIALHHPTLAANVIFTLKHHGMDYIFG